MSPEQAFSLKAKSENSKEMLLEITIAPGYLLYQDNFQFWTLKGQPLKNPKDFLPKPLTKKDELGDYKIYKNQIDIKVPISNLDKKQGIIVEYQGCSEEGFCYPPMTKQLLLLPNGAIEISNYSKESLSEGKTQENPIALDTQQNPTLKSNTFISESDEMNDLFTNKPLPLMLLICLGTGILLAFTPCMLPMVPILVNILVGQDKPLSKKRSIFLSILYVLSFALCYAAAGLAAGSAGSHIQTTLQQPVFLISLALLLSLFAFSQFGLLQVQAPQFISKLFNKLEQKPQQGGVFGAVSMGAISALMGSPCVTPFLAGILTFVVQQGNPFLGGVALFTLALGMGLPLLLFACMGSHLLPKAGKWMVYVKNFAGVLLLVLAASIMMRALPATEAPTVAKQGQFITIHNATELTEALKTARSLNKPVILDVYADWCVSCKQMDKEVFENKEVQKTLNDVHLIRLDITRQNDASAELQKHLNIIAPPMVLFFGPDGQEHKTYRLAGKTEFNNFIDRVKHFLNNATK